jgi:hypothetical protein
MHLLLSIKRLGLGVVFTLLLGTSPAFAADDSTDMPKGQGPCRSKVEELNSTRKSLKECLQSWVKAAKTMGDNPSDDCEDLTEAFVDKAKDIKSCRKEQQKQKAKAEAEAAEPELE